MKVKRLKTDFNLAAQEGSKRQEVELLINDNAAALSLNGESILAGVIDDSATATVKQQVELTKEKKKKRERNLNLQLEYEIGHRPLYVVSTVLKPLKI